MSDLYWLTEEQMARLRPFFSRAMASLGSMIGGCSAASFSSIATGYAGVMRRRTGPHKTLYNRWKRWGERGVFLRMMEGLAAAEAVPQTVMSDATYLKAHRTASSLRVKKGTSAA